jgi:competence protein ComEA
VASLSAALKEAIGNCTINERIAKNFNRKLVIALLIALVVLLLITQLVLPALQHSSVTIESPALAMTTKDNEGSDDGFVAASQSGPKSTAVFDDISGMTAGGSNIAADTSASTAKTAAPQIVVYVTGCVNAPGVYELTEGSRAAEAVAMAGGMSDEAASASINLAAVILDGQQLHIPSKTEMANFPNQNLAGTSSAQFGVGASSNSASGEGSTTDATEGGKVNINKASLEKLQTLDGIGPATAQRIIDYRNSKGPFTKIEDLKKVSGIGDKKYMAIANKICV